MQSGCEARFLSSEAADYQDLARRMSGIVPCTGTLRILEAGCGREWFVPMQGVSHEITGIDLDAEALRSRIEQRKDLHHALHGDLREVELPDASFDVIYSSYVLEHVRGAEVLLSKFARWVAPGGIIVIRVPDRDSVHGLLTRITPFWVHVLYYRWIEGLREAGTPGFAPYHTHYDAVISRAGIKSFSERNGLVLESIALHGDYSRGPMPFRMLIPAVARLISILSLGRYSARSSNVTFVLRRAAG